MVDLENKSKAELIDALLSSMAAEREYSVLLDESSDPIFAFYPDGTYRYVNRAFANGVGKSVEQIVGFRIWDVFSKEEADKRFAAVKSVFASGELREIEVRVPTPLGDRYYLTTVKPILDDTQSVITVICISKNITERKVIQRELEGSRDQAIALIEGKTRAENDVRQLNELLEQRVLLRTKDLEEANQRLTASEAALRQLVQEKESLLLEVHHRVKNNLQIITSLLRMEQNRSKEPTSRAVLTDMTARIRSMAILHEKLYHSDEIAGVELAQYVSELAQFSFAGQAASPGRVELRLSLDPVQVSLQQAIPLGLLTNEVISNSLKHGFPEGRSGEVELTLKVMEPGHRCCLQISDSGVGLPDNFHVLRTNSLGLSLVKDLTMQLGGVLDISQATQGGVSVRIEIPLATNSLQSL